MISAGSPIRHRRLDGFRGGQSDALRGTRKVQWPFVKLEVTLVRRRFHPLDVGAVFIPDASIAGGDDFLLAGFC